MEWKKCLLSDLIIFQRGHDLPKSDMVPGEYPVVGSNGIIGYHNEYTTDAPSITIGRSGNVGKPYIYYGKSWSHNTTLYIKEFKNSDPIFMYYFLKTLDLGNYAGGSAVPTLNRNHIHSLEVTVPQNIYEQKAIASVLKAIDDKIDANSKINYNLEQQATTLFRRYYDASVESVPFTSMMQVLGGGTPKTGESTYWNGPIPFFTPKDVGVPYAFITEKTITEEGLNHCNSRLYPLNTVFVTARGTVGKVSLAGCPMAMNQSCYAIVGRDIDQLLAYHYTLVIINKLKHKASGAVFDAIITKDFETESLLRLSVRDSEEFLSVAKPMYKRILSNCLENMHLASVRDALLPRLMTGNVDVSEVKI